VNRLWARLGRAAPFVVVAIIVSIFALLCVGLYAGDRYADRRAEQQAAETLQPALGTPALPQVDIKGFPFLTQLAAGSDHDRVKFRGGIRLGLERDRL